MWFAYVSIDVLIKTVERTKVLLNFTRNMNFQHFIILLLLSIASFAGSALGIKGEDDIHRILRTGGNKAKCSANVACAAKKLAGDCCPTTSGVNLDCCKVKSARCSDNTACKNLGLQGNCCPTKDGVLLDCCKAWTRLIASNNSFMLGMVDWGDVARKITQHMMHLYLKLGGT